MERMKLRDLEATLEPLLAAFRARRSQGEAFGDFVARIGFAALRQFAEGYVPEERLAALPQVCVSVLLLHVVFCVFLC